jgi:UDP-glucose 4-epimerase
VVVTGASGNVGTALLRALSGPDWDVTGVTRRQPAYVPPYHNARWIECDLGADGAADRLAPVLAGAEAVVHLAWAIQPSPDEPAMARTNLAGTRALLTAVASAAVPHLVCASSVAAYRPAGRWTRVGEAWPLDGVEGSAYSMHKAAQEQILDAFQPRYPDTIVARIRPCAIVSAEAGAEHASWLVGPLLPTAAVGRPYLPMPAWRGLRLQVIHAADVADAIRRILESHASGAFNLAAEPPLRREELANAGVSSRRVPYPLVLPAACLAWRAGLSPLHPGWLRLADRSALAGTERARAELGWVPRVDAITAMREAVQAIRQARPGGSPPLAPHRRRPCPPVRLGHPLRQSQSATRQLSNMDG